MVADSGAWGEFHKHFGGPTSATAEVLSGYLDLKPGQRAASAAPHVDEEFLYLVEGSGTWFLNGKTIPAKTGDVLYTAPNDLHGIKNTGTHAAAVLRGEVENEVEATLARGGAGFSRSAASQAISQPNRLNPADLAPTDRAARLVT